MYSYPNPYQATPANPYQSFSVAPTSYGQQVQGTGLRSEVIRVNGRNGAEAYQLAANSSILLLDESAPIVWLKATDGAGYPTITPYSITPYQPEPQIDVKSLESRVKSIEEIISKWENGNGKSNNRNAKSNRMRGNLGQIKQMVASLRAMKDPQTAMQHMMTQNPQMKQAMEYVNANGGNAKEAFYKLAKEQGINPQEIEQAITNI